LLAGAFFISLAGTFRIWVLEPYLRILPMVVFLTALALCLEISLDYPLYRLIRGYDFDLDVSLAVFNRATVTVALLLIPSIAILRQYYSDPICLVVVALTIIPLLSMTESQSAQLALLVGITAVFLFPYNWKWSWAGLGLCIYALMLALPFIANWAFAHFAADIEAVPFFGEGGGYAGARMEIWDYVSRYALQNPLYGFGVEATRQVQHFGSGEIYQQGQTILHPHNFALQLWMEFGLIGVTLGAALIGYLLLQMKHLSVAQSRVTLPTLVAVLSVASTGYGMWQGWWLGLLFVVFGYCLLAIRLMESEGVDAMSNT
jgi:O-antigen ligase